MMKLLPAKPTLLHWQLLVWGIVFLMDFISILPFYDFQQAALFTFISLFFYAIIVYGNINLLFPRYYEKNHPGRYIALTLLFLIIVCTIQTYVNLGIYYRFFSPNPKPITFTNVINTMVTGFVVYIISLVLRFALAYFKLKKQTEHILEQKSLAELNLLKSQVQPHFLFNTLNNIYYEAFRESRRTAMLIGRLSEIMRYFVDESPKERVALTTEIDFLENYIVLEKIRIRDGVKVVFIKETDGNHTIPPMLLITFVENIFKHGINRSGGENKIILSLHEDNRYLIFKTENTIPDLHASPVKKGFGIRNLQKRLTLLYGKDFEIKVYRSDQLFHSFLKIPLYEPA